LKEPRKKRINSRMKAVRKKRANPQKDHRPKEESKVVEGSQAKSKTMEGLKT
jgi:hypothetical protein